MMLLRYFALVLVLLAGAVGAQQPCDHISETSSFPPKDTVPLAGSRTCAKDYMNRLRNLGSEMQDYVLQLIETPCQTVSVAAGARSTFSLTTQMSLNGTETISASIRDLADPPMFDQPQVASASGTTINVSVFNHADSIRQGKLCAAVMRP